MVSTVTFLSRLSSAVLFFLISKKEKTYLLILMRCPANAYFYQATCAWSRYDEYATEDRASMDQQKCIPNNTS